MMSHLSYHLTHRYDDRGTFEGSPILANGAPRKRRKKKRKEKDAPDSRFDRSSTDYNQTTFVFRIKAVYLFTCFVDSSSRCLTDVEKTVCDLFRWSIPEYTRIQYCKVGSSPVSRNVRIILFVTSLRSHSLPIYYERTKSSDDHSTAISFYQPTTIVTIVGTVARVISHRGVFLFLGWPVLDALRREKSSRST